MHSVSALMVAMVLLAVAALLVVVDPAAAGRRQSESDVDAVPTFNRWMAARNSTNGTSSIPPSVTTVDVINECNANQRRRSQQRRLYGRQSDYPTSGWYADVPDADGDYGCDTNDHSHMTYDDFATFYCNHRSPIDCLNTTDMEGAKRLSDPKRFTRMTRDMPTMLDWRNMCIGGDYHMPVRVVGPVMDQGLCGSCWAFAAADAILAYSQIGTATGQSMSQCVTSQYLYDPATAGVAAGNTVSVQALLDCAVPLELGVSLSQVCGAGGVFTWGFDLLVQDTQGWLIRSQYYPYTGIPGQCMISRQAGGQSGMQSFGIAGYHTLGYGNEVMLMRAVQMVPAAAAINAGRPSIQVYSTGVYADRRCNPYKLNHGVLVIGWDVYINENNDQILYWNIKNSWGTSWGYAGYLHLLRGCNMCGVATYAAYMH